MDVSLALGSLRGPLMSQESQKNNYVKSSWNEVSIFVDNTESLGTKHTYKFPHCNCQNWAAELGDKSPLPCDFPWMDTNLFDTRVGLSQLI